jgi:hypothetical protein
MYAQGVTIAVLLASAGLSAIHLPDEEALEQSEKARAPGEAWKYMVSCDLWLLPGLNRPLTELNHDRSIIPPVTLSEYPTRLLPIIMLLRAHELAGSSSLRIDRSCR